MQSGNRTLCAGTSGKTLTPCTFRRTTGYRFSRSWMMCWMRFRRRYFRQRKPVVILSGEKDLSVCKSYGEHESGKTETNCCRTMENRLPDTWISSWIFHFQWHQKRRHSSWNPTFRGHCKALGTVNGPTQVLHQLAQAVYERTFDLLHTAQQHLQFSQYDGSSTQILCSSNR